MGRHLHAVAATFALAALASLGAACGGERDAVRGGTDQAVPAAEDGGASAPAAESAAVAVREALDDRFRTPVSLGFAGFVDPRTGDSLRGYVLRISVPFDMVEGDTLPHEWLRESLRARGWALDDEADGPDGSSYRASREALRLYLQATWEDLHLPAEVPDWYAVTVGLPAAGPADGGASR